MHAPREAARQARRAALLETAEQVFAERGFAGATMAEIAARAGYSAGNLYNIFDSKEALYREALATRGARFIDHLISSLQGEGTFLERIDRYIDASLAFVEKHRDFFVVLSQPTGLFEWGTGVSSPDAHELRDVVRQEFERLCEKAVAVGEIPPAHPRVYFALIGGSVSAYVARWIGTKGSPTDLWELRDQLRSVLHRALGAVG